MTRLALTALAAAGITLISGCGQPPGQSSAESASAESATTSSGPVTQSSAGTASGTLSVVQQGAGIGDVWSVRIERPDASTVSETAYPSGQLALTTQLAPGQYRVLSWRRPCAGPCATAGEQGLAALQDVCGAQVTITADETVRRTVLVNPDGSCSLEPTP